MSKIKFKIPSWHNFKINKRKLHKELVYVDMQALELCVFKET